VAVSYLKTLRICHVITDRSRKWVSHGFSPKIGEMPQELKVKTRPTSCIFFFFIRRLTSFVKGFGLLNDVFPFYSILDTDCPIFDIQLTDILYYIVFPSLFGPSLGSCS